MTFAGRTTIAQRAGTSVKRDAGYLVGSRVVLERLEGGLTEPAARGTPRRLAVDCLEITEALESRVGRMFGLERLRQVAGVMSVLGCLAVSARAV